MKRYLICLVLFIVTGNIYGQQINYQKSFDDAKTLAAKEHKPIFVLLTVKPRPLPDSIRKFIRNDNGFDDKGVAEFYSKKFVSFKADIADTTSQKLRQKYQLVMFPAYVFLDDQGEIVYKAGGNYPAPEKYMDIAKQALNRIASGNTIGNFARLYKEGKLNSREQLKNYITLREEFNQNDEPALIDKYVGYLTINELDDYNEVLFILKAGPLAYGKAYKLAYTNQKIIDSIYKRSLSQ